MRRPRSYRDPTADQAIRNIMNPGSATTRQSFRAAEDRSNTHLTKGIHLDGTQPVAAPYSRSKTPHPHPVCHMWTSLVRPLGTHLQSAVEPRYPSPRPTD